MTLTVKDTSSAPLVPEDALIVRHGKVFVPLVRGSTAHLVPVNSGYKSGYAVEAGGDVSAGDMIAVNLGQSAIDGQRVQTLLDGEAQ